MQQNIELGNTRKRYINGFPSLAAFIADDKYKSAAIYRRFDRLSSRNLLYLQSKLVELEAEQDGYDAEDLKDSDMVAKQCARSWSDFAQNAALENRHRERERMVLAEKIRGTLKEYREREAIILEHAVLNLSHPSSRTLTAFRNWFHGLDRPDGQRAPKLGGRSAHVLDDENDLIALHPAAEQNRLTEFVYKYLGIFFQAWSPPAGCPYVSETSVSRAVTSISVALAAGLLIGAIVSLYNVEAAKARLWMIAGYTCAFSISVGLLTNARLPEVFAAAAA
ncbi:hypothetical protein FGG08_003107 [Glutinoglossum americanum]|uniref:DUF6594 domain-containing protein n=1 Tax=Glutinoglossum americanum TaxID=1670608 RepID=A0A9P8HZ00_9PEZI|nr:hypothetical protein FGG08_003107 [Glutinoglossum americanum]